MKSINKKQNRAALYIRVSDDILEGLIHDGIRQCDPEVQKNILRQFCKIQGYILNDQHIYEDIGYSGASSVDERPALKRLVKNAKKKKFDVVVVYRFDRLTRRVKLLTGILKVLNECGIRVRSISESLDTSTPFGRVSLNLMCVFAELERDIIIEGRKKGCRY